ncbi:MAG: hypothetical protein U9P63_00105, partial [Patescibacteria group bacterium]|nr:hypothetical protein [Patescibacteria group bacterium]
MNKVGKGVSLNFCLEKIIEYWICLIIFLIPAYIFSFKIWLIPTNPLEILIGVLFIFWFFLNFRELPKIAKGVFKNRFFLPIFLIFLGITLSTIFSADIKTSAGIWKGWFVVPLLFFIVVANETKNKKQSKNIVLSLFFSGVGVALISLFYFFSNNLTYDGRLSGFYISPNYLAMYLSPVLILSLWLYFCLEKRLFKVFLFIGQCLLLATVFLTYSYSAWAGLAAALFFISVFQKLSSRNSVSGWKPSFCVLLIIISFFFSQINSLKFQELLDFSYPSLSSRLAIWQSAGE